MRAGRQSVSDGDGRAAAGTAGGPGAYKVPMEFFPTTGHLQDESETASSLFCFVVSQFRRLFGFGEGYVKCI